MWPLPPEQLPSPPPSPPPPLWLSQSTSFGFPISYIKLPPLQCSFLENPMDRGAWWATVHGAAELDMTEHACTHYSIWYQDSHFYFLLIRVCMINNYSLINAWVIAMSTWRQKKGNTGSTLLNTNMRLSKIVPEARADRQTAATGVKRLWDKVQFLISKEEEQSVFCLVLTNYSDLVSAWTSTTSKYWQAESPWEWPNKSVCMSFQTLIWLIHP